MGITVEIIAGKTATVMRKRTWCFWSTTKTIQNEVPSVTAIIETLIAVPLYWWIALHIGVVQPLLISVIIAPLVLLRSENSVALGITWFLRFEENDVAYENMSAAIRRRFWAAIALCAVISVILTLLIILHLLNLLEIKLLLIYILSIYLAITIFYSISILLSIVLPELELLTGDIILTLRDYVPYALVIIALFPGFVLGIFIRATMIRVAATLVYLGQGIKSLPLNFRRITFCTSPISDT